MLTPEMIQDEVITISKIEYNRLLDDQVFLECLRNNGVDNWMWYSEAVMDYNKIVGEDNDN